ncbi:MAG: hypothetical protein AAF531_23385 [Actinomycetota bacterium]
MNLDQLVLAARPEADGPTDTVTDRHRSQLDQLIGQSGGAVGPTRLPGQSGDPRTPLVEPATAGPSHNVGRRARLAYVAAVAAGLVVIGVAAVTLVDRGRPAATPGRGADATVAGYQHPGWYVPAALAPGWRIDLAFRDADIGYVGLRDGSGYQIRIVTGTSDHFGSSWASVDLVDVDGAGGGWIRGDRGASLRMLDNGLIQAFEPFNHDDLPASLVADIDTMRMLVLVGDEDLPIDPIDLVGGPYRPMAATVFDGQTYTLGLAGPSGRYGATAIYAGTEPGTDGLASSRGCCRSLDTQGDAVRIIEVWPSDDGNGVLVAGFARQDVAEVTFGMTDGRSATVRPETGNHGLPVNLFVTTVPSGSGSVEGQAALDHVDRVVSRDGSGNQIEVLTDLQVN